MRVRFECGGRLLCEVPSWDGELPTASPDDSVTLTLEPRVGGNPKKAAERAVQATFRVRRRRFVLGDGFRSTVILDVEPL